MCIEVQEIQSWIGADVFDGAGQKLGKLEEVYFGLDRPLVIGIRSGLAGRKHHAAVLRGASVNRDSLHLDPAAAAVPSNDAERLGDEELTKLAAQDDRLVGVERGDLEGWHARVERLADEAQALVEADKLASEAADRADEEAALKARAREADRQAEEARLAREDADERARQALENAEPAG
jgi:PRC-barrel domain